VGGKKGMKDVANDLSLSMGLKAGHKKRFNQRKRTTEKAIRDLGGVGGQVHITGHSLGGGTANYAVAQSKLIRDNLTSLNTFNTAAHPVFNSDLKISTADKLKLKGRVVHHRKENDAVSFGLKTYVPLGGVVKTTNVVHDDKKGKSMVSKIVNKHPLVKLGSMGSTSLNAHSMAHYTGEDD
jgi:hypothetical protein